MSSSDSDDLPSDADIVTQLRVLHRQTPNTSRNELLGKLKQDSQYAHLSNKYLKKLLCEYDLESETLPPPATDSTSAAFPSPPALPKDAFAALQTYRKDSTRVFRLYGRGEHDFGVSPNSEQQIRIDVIHERMMKAGSPGPFDAEAKKIIGEGWPMQDLLSHYLAAAKETSGEVTTEDVGRQLEAEYGVDPLLYRQEDGAEYWEQRRRVYKENSMKLKREALKQAVGRQYIKVDGRGEPIWDEEMNGEFAELVVRINKGDGLTEYGRVG